MNNILKKCLIISIGAALAVSYTSCADDEGSELRQKELLGRGADSITPVNIGEYFELEDRYNDIEALMESVILTEEQVSSFNLGTIATEESLDRLLGTLTDEERTILSPLKVNSFEGKELRDVLGENLIEEKLFVEAFDLFIEGIRERNVIGLAIDFFAKEGITDLNEIAKEVNPNFVLETSVVYSVLDILKTDQQLTLLVSDKVPNFGKIVVDKDLIIKSLGLGLETNEERAQFFLNNIINGKFNVDNLATVPFAFESFNAGQTVSFDVLEERDTDDVVLSTSRVFNEKYKLNELLRNIDAQNNGFINELSAMLGDFTPEEEEEIFGEDGKKATPVLEAFPDITPDEYVIE